MAKLEEYAEKYECIRMERRDGILQVTFHTRGGAFKWGEGPKAEVYLAFEDIGSDIENKVVIMTGTGDSFLADREGPTPHFGTPMDWQRDSNWEGVRILMNLLDIEVPMISAVNGPALIHSIIPVMSDIVLASENAAFQDSTHFIRGTVPGDGVHVVWPLLLGANRGKYFLLTGQKLSAREALELGVVNEVLSKEALLPRAWELAEQLARKPALTLRYSRVLFTFQIKRLMQDMLPYGMALEGLAYVDKTMGES